MTSATKTVMRRQLMKSILSAALLLILPLSAVGQESAEQDTSPPATAEQPAAAAPEAVDETTADPATPPDETPATGDDADTTPESDSGSEFEKQTEEATEKAKEIAGEAADKAAEIAVKIDENEAAREAAAGILQPIYIAAETLAFPAFYWLAFALMAAGVVSFALQLVLGKLVVLSKGSINLKEILSDAISLIISVIGLVLTTQAATENSTFTQSAALVLSSAAVGAVLGLFLYRWGQSLEVSAVAGQRVTKPKR